MTSTPPPPPNVHSPSPLTVLAFGEVLWDVIGDREFIGGAPFNFAAHAVRSGLAAELYSRVGDDARGRKARDELRRLGVRDSFLQMDPERPTGWVDVQLREGEPSYTIAPNAAWDAIEPPIPVRKAALQTAPFAALACGTLAQRSAASRDALQQLRRLLPNVPVFYDVNLRPPHTPFEIVKATLPGVSILKVNATEAGALAAYFYGQPLSATDLFSRLRSDFGVKLMVITRGGEGATLVSEARRIDADAIPIKLASAVGAGDAFAASFLAGWLHRKPTAEILRRANRIGAWVASQPETIPNYPPELAPG